MSSVRSSIGIYLYCIRSNAQISSRSLPMITNPRK